ncbi:hypothetical protein [Streptomyces antioxidans]|uniref:hypothetical protein n=1 Tax=Streptomyces TaxID=1883 RepID=UPI00117D84C2|nr:hypothetical protein [Streptomyces antioxidans]
MTSAATASRVKWSQTPYPSPFLREVVRGGRFEVIFDHGGKVEVMFMKKTIVHGDPKKQGSESSKVVYPYRPHQD